MTQHELFCLSFLASSITSFFFCFWLTSTAMPEISFENTLLHFLQFPCWDCLELLPFLVHSNCCIQNLHRLWQRDKFVNQSATGHRSKSFTCPLCRRFMRFHKAIIHCFGHLANFSASHSLSRCLFVFYTASREPWVFPIFTSHLREFVITVVWVGKVNSSQSSSIVEFLFLVFPILDSERLYPFWSILLAIHDLVCGSRLNFCQSFPGPHISFRRFLFH